ncbi:MULTISPECIES: hypothetical protein [Gordonia]|jgi:Mce-associated membrane protein|uniref:Mce-associated membrane protein n=5 Tax=Gordonia TaxID=2053 RepID=A0AAW6RIB4_GORRU|nr:MULTISPECIES: hypothetical protein [Gordonia]MDY6808778.1 hypothetical protein [Actinomycetota bacterium]ASR04997.1 hypothetical protein GCWB2_21125 [Gordonia rubripertincta]EON30468.1 Mce associated protein [Gordonia terrae C-6]MAU84327.1 hypothetical protein [Gordonia sp. (in: high G+C Gram-positive bacteria)]MCR8900129.1 hypothetical protein [Gordonia sp. GONU]
MAVVTDQVEATGPEVDDDAVGPESAGEGAGTAPLRSVVTVWALVAALVAVLALLGVKGTDLYQAKQDEKRNSEVLDVTREVVAGLVSLDYRRSKADLDRIKSVATGSFQQQFEQLATSFEQVLSSGEVLSTGSVKEAGIITADDDAAQVLAAVSSIVKNTEAPDGQQRVYRMKVDLTAADHAWKVSNVEFVS